MTTQPQNLRNSITRLVNTLVILLLATVAANAQWTTPDGSGNINNTNSGNVGIGTSTPGASLEVKKSQNAGTSIYVDNPYTTSPNSAFPALMLRQNGVNRLQVASANDGHSIFPGGTGVFWNFVNAPMVWATNGTERMRLSATGKLAIGTTVAPNAYLHIAVPSAEYEALRVYRAGTGPGWGVAQYFALNNSSGAMTDYAQISGVVGSNTAGSENGALIFVTKNAGTLAEKARIDNAGNFGIGTSAPDVKLQVFHSSSNTSLGSIGLPDLALGLRNTSSTNGNMSIISFQDASGYGNVNIGAIQKDQTNHAADLAFFTRTNTTTFGERMRIDSVGNVGVGTTTPGYRLDVQGGSINSSGGLCIAGVCKTDWSQVGSQWTGTSALNYSGNVGVGLTSAPTRKLEVLGGNVFHQFSTTAGSEYGFYTSLGSNHLASNLYFDGSWKMIATGKGSLVSVSPNANGNAFSVYADNTSRAVNAIASPIPIFVVALDGKVGVSTSTPTYSLDVNGGVNGFRAKAASALSTDTIATFENSSAIQMIVRANGNIGVGNTAPTEKLHVTGNIKVTGNIDVGGNINAKYQDMAEWVESSQPLTAGTVVVLDPDKNNQVVASTQSYDSRVAGVISPQPGIALGDRGEGRVLVAATGRVKVKVDAGNGPIKIGDLLVTSDKEGFAMKSVPVEFGGVRMHRPGTLIGKALEPLASGTGEILVLLSLQ